ncbi:MAG: NUDIX domain-containing protein [Chloroflexi bacterium]|nr:NUDIX domain-containing protein [Chloroflexota bacterium]
MVKVISGERVGKQGRLTVGCSAAIFDSSHQRILLVRRSDNGQWTVPGGYMEAGESLTEACAREVKEETGLDVRVTRLIAVYTNPHILLEYPDGNRWQVVVLHFEAKVINGYLSVSDETTEFKYFSWSEIANLTMGSLGRQRILDSFEMNQATLIRDTFSTRDV